MANTGRIGKRLHLQCQRIGPGFSRLPGKYQAAKAVEISLAITAPYKSSPRALYRHYTKSK